MSSQLEPLNPGVHAHLNELGELLHVPPLKQGLERHLFMSISQFLPCKHKIINNITVVPAVHKATYIKLFWACALVVISRNLATCGSILAGPWETGINSILTATTKKSLTTHTLIIIKQILYAIATYDYMYYSNFSSRHHTLYYAVSAIMISHLQCRLLH